MMEYAIDRLLALRVSDVMTKNVVVTRQTDSIAQAAALFAQRDVSAAPVVDDQGRCVGILSVVDFAAHNARTDQTVGERMTRVVQSISSGNSLLAAARTMCSHHVHRLPVLDDNHPVGVISTMDVVAALVNAIDEMKSNLDHRGPEI